MSNPFIPIQTANLNWREGAPFSQDFNDVYCSIDSGLKEKEHVFIKGNNLIERWGSLKSDQFLIAEIGFGTGLNFLLTWFLWLKHAPKRAKLHFISCELFPLTPMDLRDCLSLWPSLQQQAKLLLENYPLLTPGFHQLEFEKGRVNLTLMLGQASDCYKQLLLCGDPQLESQLRNQWVDAWYLDGFAPKKNQALWSKDLFQIINLLSKQGTSLATYSSSALVRTNLEDTGFLVKKIKGFGRKREMVVGQFKNTIDTNKKLRKTAWQINQPKQEKSKKAIVLGAGLAGCFTAYALAKRGFNVLLLDKHHQVAQGASGNIQAVLYPKISAFQSPLTQFMLLAYLFALRFYHQLDGNKLAGNLSGVLQLVFNKKEQQSQRNLTQWLKAYPELAGIVNAKEASALAGIPLDQGGLFIPKAGWLDEQALCRLLQQKPGIHWHPDTQVDELNYEDGLWHVDQHSAATLVLANGYQANQFPQTAFLPLKSIRGQMTLIATTKESQNLKIPICAEGHVLPASNQQHALGASYQIGNTNSNCFAADDLENLKKLINLPTPIAWSNEILSNWSGIRATTTDYLPLVGPIPNESLFRSQFVPLASNAKRWIPQSGAYLPGLFLCAGFGSRGLTSIPLASEFLASMINQEFLSLPQAMIRSLSPARFLIKEIVRQKN